MLVALKWVAGKGVGVPVPLGRSRGLTLDAAGVEAVGEERLGTGDGQLGDASPLLLLLLLLSSLYAQY